MAIAKQDFDQVLNMARVRLVGASDAGLKAELYDVLSEFFNDSRCWMESIRINVVTDTTAYEVTPSEGQIIGLVGVFNSENIPQPATMPNLGTVILTNTPNVAEAPLYYYVIVSKTVQLPTNKDQLPIGPDWVLPKYHAGILDGLLGHMMMHADRPYTDEKRSAYYLRRFRSAIAMARVSALRQNTVGAQAWRFPQSFATRTQRNRTAGVSGSDRSF